MLTLLQFDFPFAGPWGEAATEAFRGLAEDIATTPGLRWKIWTENPATGRAGGIYLFEDEGSARAYLDFHTRRLQNAGIRDIRALELRVNETLSQVDRAPLGQAASAGA